MRLLLFAIAIIWLGKKAMTSNVRDIQDKVKEGTTVATEIIQALGDDKVSKTFGKIGKIAAKIGPFLGAIGPAISLLSLFSDTPEMTAIKDGFAKMDAKFDEVFNKFNEVHNLIRETSLKNQYASYEHTIRSLSTYLQRMLSAPTKKQAATYKAIFIEKYTHSDRLATSKILQGMMGEGVMSANIPTEAMKFFDNDRKKVQKVIKGTINLILQGVKVELAYEKAIGNETLYLTKQKLWKDRVIKLVRKSTEYDNAVKNKFRDQIKTDIDKKLQQWSGKSHEYFANNLYSFLLGKYDWRIWFVVSYKELNGAERHWGHVCSGYNSFRRYGRNVRVASVDSHTTFNRQLAGTDLMNVKTKHCKTTWWGSSTCDQLNAHQIYNNLPQKRRSDCRMAAAAGVIVGASDEVKWKAPWNRMNYVLSTRHLIYLFG